MPRKKKATTHAPTTDSIFTPTTDTTPLPAPPVADERIKTSVVLLRSSILLLHQRARLLNISFNAAVNLALYDWLYGPAPATIPFSRQPDDLAPPPSASPVPSASPAPPAPPAPTRDPQPQPPQPYLGRAGAQEPKRPSDGYHLRKESPDDDECYATWEEVDAYVRACRNYPTTQPHDIPQKIGMALTTWRAADIASQGTPEYRRWLRYKKAHRRWREAHAEAVLAQKMRKPVRRISSTVRRMR